MGSKYVCHFCRRVTKWRALELGSGLRLSTTVRNDCSKTSSLWPIILHEWRRQSVLPFETVDVRLPHYRIFRSSPERWPNKPGKNVRPSVHNQTQCSHKPDSGICYRVDETFTTIWLSRTSEVRVKVTWDLKFQKWRFSNSISSAIFQPIKKIQRFLILDQNI